MQTTTLGRGGPRVSRVGLGPIGHVRHVRAGRGQGERRARSTPRSTRGSALLDTGDFYRHGPQRDAAASRRCAAFPRDKVFIQVKFGRRRRLGRHFHRSRRPPGDGQAHWPTRCGGLGTDYVDLHRPGPLDSPVPVEETVGAIAEMMQRATSATSGCPRSAPEPSAARRASSSDPELQIDYSLMSRWIEASDTAHRPRSRHQTSLPPGYSPAACSMPDTGARHTAPLTSGAGCPGFVPGQPRARSSALLDRRLERMRGRPRCDYRPARLRPRCCPAARTSSRSSSPSSSDRLREALGARMSR